MKNKFNLYRFLSSWQGFTAGLIALSLFFISPTLIRLVDPTAAVLDGGAIHIILYAATIFWVGVFMAWTGFQVAFKSMDRWADAHIADVFESAEFTDKERFYFVQGMFTFMLILWFVAITLAIG